MLPLRTGGGGRGGGVDLLGTSSKPTLLLPLSPALRRCTPIAVDLPEAVADILGGAEEGTGGRGRLPPVGVVTLVRLLLGVTVGVVERVEPPKGGPGVVDRDNMEPPEVLEEPLVLVGID